MAKINLKPFYRSDVIQQFQEADFIIASGTQAFNEGSLFQKRQSIPARATNLFVLYWGLYEVFITKLFKKPFMTFPQSIGPFKSYLGKFAINYILNNSSIIFLREKYSLRFLEDFKRKAPLFISADMAFIYKSSKKDNDYQVWSKPLIGVSPCFPHSFTKKEKDNYVFSHARILDNFINDHNAKIIFLPSVIGKGETEKRERALDDFEVSNLILHNMVNKTSCIIESCKDPSEFVKYIEKLDMLIATRMHPTILAATRNVPFVSIIYEHKQIGLLQNLDIENNSVDINEVHTKKFSLVIEHVWKKREEISKYLAYKVPIIQARLKEEMEKYILAIIKNH